MQSIFVGLIFLFFNFTLNLNNHVLNLMPAFVGYLLINIGAKSLENTAPVFKKILTVCIVLAALGVVSFVLDLLGLSYLGILSSILSLVFLAGNIYITFYITQGVLDIESTKVVNLQGAELRNIWKISTIVSCFNFVCSFIIPILLLFTMFVSLIISIIFMVRFYRTYKLAQQYNI